MSAGLGLPWMKIRDFLAEAGQERSVRDFKAAVLRRIGDLIPFDVSAHWLDMGPTRPVKLCEHLGLPADWVASHNLYYYKIAPEFDFSSLKLIYLNRHDLQNTEYYQDFMRPMGIRHAAALILHDSRGVPALNLSLADSRHNYERNRQVTKILKIIQPILANYYVLLNLNSVQAGGRGKEELRRLYKLTDREFDIVELISAGLAYKEVADKLAISVKTVGTHLANIYDKLNVSNRVELVKIVRDLGIGQLHKIR